MDAAEPSGGTLLAPPVVLLDEELVELLVPDVVVLDEVVAPVVVPIVPPSLELLSESSPQPKARPRRKTLATHSVNRMGGSIRRRRPFFKANESYGRSGEGRQLAHHDRRSRRRFGAEVEWRRFAC